MASLYGSAATSRKILIGFLIFVAGVTILNIYQALSYKEDPVVIDNSQRYYLNSSPIFGIIDEVNFEGIAYNLDAQFNLNGRHIQEFPDTSFVYQVEKPRNRVLDLSNIEKIANNLGFTGIYNKSGNIVQWLNLDKTKDFTIDLENRIWSLKTKYLENESALARKVLLESDLGGDDALEIEYEKKVNDILNTLGLRSAYGFTEPYVKAEIIKRGIDGFIVDVDEVSEAEYIHIAISRVLPLIELKPRGERPEGDPPIFPSTARVYSDDPREGQIRAIVSNRLRDFTTDLFELDFTDFEYKVPTELTQGVYAIITPDEAWSKVQLGEGALEFIRTSGSNYFANYSNVDVLRFEAQSEKTKLGFYEPNEWTGFVTPIYVFEGIATMKDGSIAEFIFYVDAIKRAL